MAEVDRVAKEVSAPQAECVGCALKNFLDWCGPVSLDQITTETLVKYQQHRKENPSARTKRPAAQSTIRREISFILRLLRLNGFQVDRPRPIRSHFTPNRHFTNDELQRFFEHCPREWKTLFLTLLCAGARPAELVPSKRSSHTALLREEVDPRAGVIVTRSAKRCHDGPAQKRAIPVHREMCSRILEEAPEDSIHAFRCPGIGMSHLFDGILAEARIPKKNALGEKLTAHSFRHTFATLFHQAAQGDLSLLRGALGHTQITTTQIYDHYEGKGAPVIDIAPYLEAAAE